MTDSYYGAQAYHPATVPQQPAAPRQSWLERNLTAVRLPWGSTQEIAPPNMVRNAPPEKLRERDKLLEEQARLHAEGKGAEMDVLVDRQDQEVLSYAPVGRIYRILNLMNAFGYVITVYGPIVVVPSYFMFIFLEAELSLKIIIDLFLFCLYVYSPGPVLWGVAQGVTRFLPARWWFKPGKKLAWCFNRRTGMVTFYKKRKAIDLPFYECDAYITSTPGTSGVMFYSLMLAHRYQNLKINLSILAPWTNNNYEALATWDCLQNFMDISRPLPDIGPWECFRSLDPVTKAQDELTGRNPRYWRDMSETEFKHQLRLMEQTAVGLTTFTRPNAMARCVHYL